MLELGPEEIGYHRWLGRKIDAYGFDAVLAYGNLSRVSIDAVRENPESSLVEFFLGPEEAGEFLKRYLKPGDSVLFKASRGMKIEKVIHALEGVEVTE